MGRICGEEVPLADIPYTGSREYRALLQVHCGSEHSLWISSQQNRWKTDKMKFQEAEKNGK